MGPYQRTPKEVARAIRYSGLGVRSVGPVGDFLDFFVKRAVVEKDLDAVISGVLVGCYF